jgi:NAD+ kinase
VTPVVGIVAHQDRVRAQELACEAARWLDERGVTVRAPQGDAARAGLSDYAVALESFADGLDLIVAVGGDGTMLRAVELAAGGPAVLGVNAGQLGYLAEVEPAALPAALERIVTGQWSVDERMTLSIRVKGRSETWTALNEVVIEKHGGARAVRLATAINDAPFTTYVADGVIVATPTGSTAYAFSAGGPIVAPRLECFVLVPVAPHTLFDRALVLDGHDRVRFEVVDRPAVLVTDGRRTFELEPGAVVECHAGRPTRIASLGDRDFHQILKAKFGLTDR